MTRKMLLPLFVVGACARAVAPAPEAARCDLTVSFGSYAMGIDKPALAAVRSLLADRAVRTVEERRWGMEGEMNLCVRTRQPADAELLLRRIRAVLPAAPRGPITARTASGLSFEATARRRP
jgi:hypothetical protein